MPRDTIEVHKMRNKGIIKGNEKKGDSLKCLLTLNLRHKKTTLKKWLCARDWIRTSTSLRTLPPEGSASTNFATRAELSQLSIVNKSLMKNDPMTIDH